MASPITFGVEIEFNLAYLDHKENPPDPTETSQLLFPLTDEVKEVLRLYFRLVPNDPIPKSIRSEYEYLGKRKVAQYSVKNTIESIGCHVQAGVEKDSPAVWEVLFDDSVHPEENTPYKWFPMEINSPALPLNPISLELIERVCSVIAKTYVTDANQLTGVHVHLSAGSTTFEFRTMQNLIVFLWAFEHQMSSLHPEERQDSMYCRGFREKCAMVADFTEKWGKPPRILQGITEFYKCLDMTSLLSAACCCEGSKFMAFNCDNALRKVKEPQSSFKPTIECRQHQGTLDGERIVQWVKLVAGLVQCMETIHPESLLELLELVKHEKWEKSSDDKSNDLNEAKLGPILAEGALTIIDILKYLGLNESANYYRDRLFRVVGKDQ
ncbi:putative amidoligase enzyme-domain-containing protein [Leptodontidium sp. MPI-SDFR-AT-0119]|nr:putative amidoligase enzyme-domain-containing protein [Leptodontidium sp. MPI-SDFR-AT-0119]